MKRLIYILFLFIGLGQVSLAQTTDALRTERLELHLEPSVATFIPLKREWLQAQKDAWKVELDKNPRNVKSWENYSFACKEIWREDTLLMKKELPRILKEMKKYISDTRTYYRLLDDKDVTPDEEKREEIKRKIVTLKRDFEKDYSSDVRYYLFHGQMDKMKEVAREWFDSGLYSRNSLSYCYNEFVGLEKNAVLAIGRFQWPYCALLQYGMGLFKDVEVVDLDVLMNPEWDNKFWKEKGVDIQTLPDREKVECPGAWYFTEKEKRPVYVTSGNRGVEDIKNSIYSEGLVFRYSLKPYDNMAVLRRNYEQVYLLDYLRFPVVTEYLQGGDCYFLSFLPLLQFYHVSGDKNHYLRLKSLLLGIVDRMDENYFDGKAWVNSEMVERLKINKAVLDSANWSEGSSLKYRTFKEIHKKEYQQLLDGVEP